MDATGAYLAGGRWNQKGTSMLYASSTLSLACLEILVHIKEPRLPIDYGWVRFDIPEDIVADDSLNPLDLNDEQACAETGTRWVASGRSAVVLVPSVIIPTEMNVLLNPTPPAFIV